MNELVFTKLSSGLYLIATRLGGETDASITGSLSLITYSPYRICFSLEKNSHTSKLLSESKKAVISVLSTRANAALFDYFSDQKECKKEKFRTDCNDYPYALTPDGIPYLKKQANAYLICQIISTTDLGTHTLFLGEWLDGDVLHEDSGFMFRHTQTSLQRNVMSSQNGKEDNM